ncbi:MAG TPA: roadblock/LC7 domain-containing protein [Methanomicrobiales archaeon]|nr:roadblock/LC7 domain-containing protein [Methanomicrobiales archaeon]
MTTTPIPTGKIRGSLRDVTPKLRNFIGAVKVTTPSGKGGILVEMGKPVASYLTVDGVLHRGQESLDLLGKEDMAEFEILRYDDEQFREAMIICDNRGLLLAGGKPPQVPAATPPPPAREEKSRDEENVLSAMMKRFAPPRVSEKEPVTREFPKPEPRMPVKEPAPAPAPSPEPVLSEIREPEPLFPDAGEKVKPAGKQEPVPPPPQETELSAIIKRLRDSGKVEKPQAPPEERAGEPALKAPLAESEGRPKAVEPAPPARAPPGAPVAKARPKPAAGPEPGIEGMEGPEQEGRVRVDLGKMMKRIKRLDITSIRDELQSGEAGTGPAKPEAPVPAEPALAGEPPAVAAGPAASPAEERGKSDIDELKAFIQRFEVLEELKETPPEEKGIFAKLGGKPAPAEEPVLPRKKEVPPPIPRKEPPPVETIPEEPLPAEEARPVPKPPAPAEVPRPAEPDRKAKIASILRRSGLVKPPVEEPQVPPAISEIRVSPPPPVEKIEPPAPAGEAGIQAPRPQRKKVEITLVPKRPEKPLKEPPLLDEKMIQKILKQPGVIAVSTFFEGFAVQSAGRADFEQVAANAEDLFRAGKKIAREIDIGPLNQIILETGKGKLVIAPHGDLNVCIFTEPDANLGLIRVAIKSMQVDTD